MKRPRPPFARPFWPASDRRRAFSLLELVVVIVIVLLLLATYTRALHEAAFTDEFIRGDDLVRYQQPGARAKNKAQSECQTSDKNPDPAEPALANDSGPVESSSLTTNETASPALTPTTATE